MHWSQAVLMAELLMKATEKINTIKATTSTMEKFTMSDHAPTDTPAATTATVDNEPTAPSDTASNVSSNAGPVVAQVPLSESPAQSGPAPSSMATQTIIANAVEQPTPVQTATTPVETTQAKAAPTKTSAADNPDTLHQSLSDLLRLVEILNATPELLDILKRMLPKAHSSTG